MAEERIEVDTGTGELLCEIRDRVALSPSIVPRRAIRTLTSLLPPCDG